MSILSNLIERVKAGEDTDRTNADIMMALGWTVAVEHDNVTGPYYVYKGKQHPFITHTPVWNITRSMDAALVLFGKMLPEWEASINTEGHCRLFPPGYNNVQTFDLRYFHRGPTPIAALVIGILKTKEKENG